MSVDQGDPATMGWLRSYLALVTVGLKSKEEMQEAGKSQGTCPCPRCAGIVHIRLVGKRKHLRMACACGMSVME